MQISMIWVFATMIWRPFWNNKLLKLMNLKYWRLIAESMLTISAGIRPLCCTDRNEHSNQFWNCGQFPLTMKWTRRGRRIPEAELNGQFPLLLHLKWETPSFVKEKAGQITMLEEWLYHFVRQGDLAIRNRSQRLTYPGSTHWPCTSVSTWVSSHS